MSLLWPERVSAGLFPGHCWLQRGATVATHTGDFADADQFLMALDSMLEAQEKPLRRGAQVQLLVSDSLACVMPLAWQELLSSPQELRTYALAGFEQRGMTLDDGWLVQTGFRHFRSTGIAYAVRRQWMAAVLEVLAARGLRLASLLPVSAAAYWRQRASASGKRVVLLREPGRLTAMVSNGARLQDLDVQPVAGQVELAAARLLKRLAVTHGAFANLAEWRAQADDTMSLASTVGGCWPDAVVTQLPLQAWR